MAHKLHSLLGKSKPAIRILVAGHWLTPDKALAAARLRVAQMSKDAGNGQPDKQHLNEIYDRGANAGQLFGAILKHGRLPLKD